MLFKEQDRPDATRWLTEECGRNLPFCENSTPQSLERIRFAALKLSAGDLMGLLEAIELAKADWRDLLMAAGFGEDVRAHEFWIPNQV